MFHIDKAFDIIDKVIKKEDPEFYAPVILEFFSKLNIKSIEQLEFAQKLHAYKILYYDVESIDIFGGKVIGYKNETEEITEAEFLIRNQNIRETGIDIRDLSDIEDTIILSSKLYPFSKKDTLINKENIVAFINNNRYFSDIITNALNKLDAQKQYSNIQSFIIKTSQQLYSHLIKSFLQGEYLIDKDYSKKIKERIESIKENFTDATQTVLYIEKSFLKNAWLIKEVCELIDNQIKFLTEGAVRIPMDREQKANNFFTIDTKFAGKNETIVYEQLLDSVVEMTLIDHSYHVKKENIKKLLLLIEQANSLNYGYGIKTEIDLVLTKAYTLYEKFVSLLKNNKTEDKYKIDINKRNYKLIVYDIPEEETQKYSLYKKGIKVPKIIQQQKEKEYLSAKTFLENNDLSDIIRYNKTINKSIEKYNELWQQFKNLDSDNFEKLKETISFCEKKDFQELSHSFL